MPSAVKKQHNDLSQALRRLPPMPLPIQGEKPKEKTAKGKRMTLPLEDRLVLAELVDVLGITDAVSHLQGIERNLGRIADCLERRCKPAADAEDDGDIPF